MTKQQAIKLLKEKYLSNMKEDSELFVGVEDVYKRQLPNPTTIVVSGISKEVVGQTAAYVRSLRSPEPYKGKGIRYVGEFVRRKEGKTGK